MNNNNNNGNTNGRFEIINGHSGRVHDKFSKKFCYSSGNGDKWYGRFAKASEERGMMTVTFDCKLPNGNPKHC
jgi:hypothetical protein